jgi:hypothetical protein
MLCYFSVMLKLLLLIESVIQCENSKFEGMRWILFWVLFALAFFSHAQYVQIGNATFRSTYRFGPIAAESNSATHYSRYAYIYPSASLRAIGQGDSIRSISFYREGFDSLRGTVNMKIYIGNTDQADFGAGSINWRDETQVRIGIVKVYDGDPTDAIGGQPGWVRFDFNVQDYYRFDTSNGMPHLEVLVEYSQNTNPANDINWRYDTDFSFPDYQSQNETKFLYNSISQQDSLVNSSIAKPAMRLHIPKYDQEAELNMLYALGRVPLLMERADTIKSFVTNIGRKTIDSLQVYLEVKGANQFKDTLILDSLAALEQVMVQFASYRPVRMGRDSLIISLPNDGVNANNRVTAVQDVTYNIYSHADPVTPNAGGIGFNGGTGDFVAKFYTDSAKFLNQVKVDFSLGGREFQIGIWDESANGRPGRNLFTSDTLTSTQGTYILRVDPKVKVEGGFFVGLRQTGNTNIAFAFQEESPVRPNAFYFAAPLGDTNWVSFSPGFDFKFNIQPRLEVAHDISVLRIARPFPDQSFVYRLNDSIGVDAVVFNYGSSDQDTAFDVICEIRSQFGQIVHRSVRQITLDSEDSVMVRFGKVFSLNNKGRFEVIITTDLNRDQVPDNDVLRSWFEVTIPADLSITQYFVPSFNSNYELNVDSLYPVVRLLNNGSTALNNFWVWFEIRDTMSNDLLFKDSLFLSTLEADDSEIIGFEPWFCNKLGRIKALTYVNIAGDIFPSNDSLYSEFNVIKSNDVGVDTVLNPADNVVVGTNYSFRPYVQFDNEGLVDQDSLRVKAYIFKNDSLHWSDSAWTNVARLSVKQHLFKTFRTSSNISDSYRMLVLSELDQDQDPSNDSMEVRFSLTESIDLSIRDVIRPTARIPYNSPDSTFRFTVGNEGFLDFNADADFISEVWKEGVLFWRDSFRFAPSLTSGESAVYGSSRTFKPDQEGKYDAFIAVIINGDENTSNDTFPFQFFVSADFDIGLGNLQVSSDSIQCGDSLSTRVNLINFGLRSLQKDSAILNVQLYRFENLIDEYEVIIEDSLNGGLERSINLRPVTECDSGDYRLVIELLLADDNPSNQKLEILFRIDKPYDLAVDSALIPQNGDRFQEGNKMELKPSVRYRQEGSDSMSNVNIYLNLFKDGILLEHDSVQANFKGGEALDITFNTPLPMEESGKFELLYYHRDARDPLAWNDSLRIGFEVADLSSITETGELKLMLWPNPGREIIHLYRTDISVPLSVNLYDPLGRKVLEESWKINQSNFTLHLEAGMSNGLYVIELIDSKGRRHTLRWLKEE